jgi:hypothetical protein
MVGVGQINADPDQAVIDNVTNTPRPSIAITVGGQARRVM